MLRLVPKKVGQLHIWTRRYRKIRQQITCMGSHFLKCLIVPCERVLAITFLYHKQRLNNPSWLSLYQFQLIFKFMKVQINVVIVVMSPYTWYCIAKIYSNNIKEESDSRNALSLVCFLTPLTIFDPRGGKHGDSCNKFYQVFQLFSPWL